MTKLIAVIALNCTKILASGFLGTLRVSRSRGLLELNSVLTLGRGDVWYRRGRGRNTSLLCKAILLRSSRTDLLVNCSTVLSEGSSYNRGVVIVNYNLSLETYIEFLV